MISFTIITPSLNRDSLKKCCESIDSQDYKGKFEHIVAFDGFPKNRTVYSSEHRRLFSFRETRKWGNYQRHSAWKYATGSYIWYVDDDNFLSSPEVLTNVSQRLELSDNPAWGLFPIVRHGSIFLHDPPGMCMTDTMNIIVRREYGEWLNTDCREADGMLADRLKAEHPYVAFPDCPPIGIMEKSSNGL